jgi:hypothetical protein
MAVVPLSLWDRGGGATAGETLSPWSSFPSPTGRGARGEGTLPVVIPLSHWERG